jgi:hypothetical protein
MIRPPKILNSGGYRPGHDRRAVLFRGYEVPDGGGLTAAERARREQVRSAELIELYRMETR